ncbi:MAG: VWA domain-containing protein [Thermoleophilia bacterium]|nr:VWA domain-containing protein [Thermoleophilia bacterium]
MSFVWPWALWLVPLVAGLVALGAWWRRRRTDAGGLPYPDLDVFDAVAVTPRRRRFVPVVLAVLGLFALALGVARPQAERSVPRDKATVMLAIDVSGSMSAEDVTPTRLEAAQKAALQFADEMPRTFQVGLVAFSGSASVIVPPTTDREQLRHGIEQLVPDGDTAIGDALLTSLRAISESQGGVAVPDSARILLLSDGTNRTGTSLEDAIPQIQAAKVPVYTVALGTPDGTLYNGQPVPPSPETMKSVAESTGGESFAAEDSASVSDVYRNLGRFIGTVREQHDVTDWFVGAAMALLLASAAAWWRWGVRLG